MNRHAYYGQPNGVIAVGQPTYAPSPVTAPTTTDAGLGGHPAYIPSPAAPSPVTTNLVVGQPSYAQCPTAAR
uniref:Uncharacterized protein n=1 Tax=Panagrolaimus superbus TaxID=310955 RepID=A0A914ZAH6_9BILA